MGALLRHWNGACLGFGWVGGSAAAQPHSECRPSMAGGGHPPCASRWALHASMLRGCPQPVKRAPSPPRPTMSRARPRRQTLPPAPPRRRHPKPWAGCAPQVGRSWAGCMRASMAGVEVLPLRAWAGHGQRRWWCRPTGIMSRPQPTPVLKAAVAATVILPPSCPLPATIHPAHHSPCRRCTGGHGSCRCRARRCRRRHRGADRLRPDVRFALLFLLILPALLTSSALPCGTEAPALPKDQLLERRFGLTAGHPCLLLVPLQLLQPTPAAAHPALHKLLTGSAFRPHLSS